MDNIEKITIGLVLFIVTSVVAYLFRMRQLYVATPKLFRHAPISQGGSICEVIVYNRGNQAEEDVHVSLDPDLRAELLASSSADVTLEGTKLKVERLHKGCEASAVLLVENGILDSSKITEVSSKATKGRVCKKVSDVPPNFALYFLGLTLVVGAIPGLYYGAAALSSLKAAYIEHRLQALQSKGWSNLSNYFDSNLRKSYGDHEFPVVFAGRQGDRLKFDVFNKSAVPLGVSANRMDVAGSKRKSTDTSPADIEYFGNVEVPPMSQGQLLIKDPPTTGGASPQLQFFLKAGDEVILYTAFAVEPAAKR